jgi:hypothetical protein
LLDTWIVTVKSGPGAIIEAIGWKAGDVPANDAGRKYRSGSMTYAPAIERRNAAAFSSEMRATAIGGDVASRSAWVRRISISPNRPSRSISACRVIPGAAGAIMYWLRGVRTGLTRSLRAAELVSPELAVMAYLSLQ